MTRVRKAHEANFSLANGLQTRLECVVCQLSQFASPRRVYAIMETMTDICKRLETEGYTGQCRAEINGLRFLPDVGTFDPSKLHIDQVIRLEGNSVPSEETIIFALSTPDRQTRATYCVSFGPAIDPLDADILEQLDAYATAKATARTQQAT